MTQIYIFQLFYALMIAWGIYMTSLCIKQAHHLKHRVLCLYLASNAACLFYFNCIFCETESAFNICLCASYVCIDLTLIALLYYLVDFTSIGKNRSYSKKVEIILYIIFAIDILILMTNTLHHLVAQFDYYYYKHQYLIFEFTLGPLFYLHSTVCYIVVALCLDLLIKKCIITPKAYRRRYSNILISFISIIFINFIFTFTKDYLLFDISYPLYSICAYAVYKNTFFFSNSQSMQNSKRIILEYLNSPIALFDYENILTDCNKIFVEVFPEASNYHEIPISLTHFENLTGLKLLKKDSSEPILKEFEKDGEIHKYHCHIDEFNDEKGHFLGHICILNDVTKELAAIEEAENAGKAKSSFLASMSHEIRTPINAVLGMDEMILRECDQPNILEYATNINNAGKMLLTIINDILDISKMESGSMNIVPTDYRTSDLLRSLHAIIDLRAKEKNLAMEYQISPTLPAVLNGDETRIQQCITNLLTNAVKYTPSGSVTLSISHSLLKNDEILLKVAVTDSGIGIKPEDMNKLFTTFQRLDETKNRGVEGTGLGLHLTRNLITLMNGIMHVESVYGVGSTFSFEIIQKLVDATPIDLSSSDEKAVQKKYQVSFIAPDSNILVVDDNKVNLAVFKGLLKNTKIQIDTAISGSDALNKVTEKHYDLIFLDHMMPEMDGIECLEKMTKRPHLCKDAPVIALTANVFSGANLFYKEKGFHDYLSKPIDAKNLEETIIKYLPSRLVELNRI